MMGISLCIAASTLCNMEEEMKTFLQTDHGNSALLIQRMILGSVMFAHGAQKLLGWFGGYGFSGTMSFFTQQMSFPWLLALAIILAESFGALMVIAGFLTRFAAGSLSVIMLGTILTTHLQHGFFMNWFGAQQGEGIEYALLFLALSVPISFWGAGRFSVDAWLDERLSQVSLPLQKSRMT
jgi:putative oxidoreductase